jgi:uncharacterized protein (DUF1330 family)
VSRARAAAAAARLRKREERFRDQILPELPAPASMAQQLLAVFSMGQLLEQRWQHFESYQNWLEVQTQVLVPRVQAGLDYLSKQEDLPPRAGEWLSKYVIAMNEALRAVTHVYQAQAAETAAALREQAAAADAEWAEAPSLS